MDDGKRKASEVLTTNDIREGARKWTLADDVGLLAHLEQFSEKIFSKTQETQKQFIDLVDDYEELYTKVGNVTNQFLALQNCQFVENRVYDEETPTEEKTEVKVQNEVEQEKLLLTKYKEAVEVGIKLLDTHFEQVQLPPNSDSDDDDGDEVSTGSSIVWKPKNPYAGKKFPLVIGSAEWWADDLVGLGPEEDILDTEKVLSESDSDMESLKSVDKGMKSSSSSTDHINPIPTKPAFLDSSSEDLFGLDKNENFNTAASDDIFFQGNSLLSQPDISLPDFDKEPKTDTGRRRDSSGDVLPVDETQGTPPTKQPNKVDSAFTRELMAKLSSVTNKKEVRVTDEKKKMEEDRLLSAKGQPDDNLFDETDDSSDLFSAKLSRTAEIGVEKRGLFFEGENEDELFKGKSDVFFGNNLLNPNELIQIESQLVGGSILEDGKEPEKPSKVDSVVARKSVVKNLFDDLDDDDILFAAAKPESTKSSLPSEEDDALKKSKSGFTEGLVWDNDDGLFKSINAELEDDFFTSSGLFTANVNKATDSKPSEESRTSTHHDLFPEGTDKKRIGGNHFQGLNEKGTSALNSAVVEVKKSIDNPFGFSPSRESGSKKTTILNSEDDDDDDLFSKAVRGSKPALKAPAFVDDDDTALFVEKPKPSDSVSVSSSRSSLFDDTSASKSRLASVFEKDKTTNKAEDDLFSLAEDSLFGGESKAGKDFFSTKVREKVKNSLFEDCDDSDDLFGAGKGARGDRLSADVLVEAKTLEKDAPGEEGSLKMSAQSSTLRETKSEILRQSEREVFAEDLNDAELSTKATVTKPKPPDSLNLKSTESGSKVKSVGKLNIPDNLKVKFESAAKHIAGGGQRPSSEDKEEADKANLLDETPRSSNLLKCPSKDRVKIPGRRRPQSRRARQEAIRNSGMWDQESSPNTSASTLHPSKDSLSSPVVSNPLSPSTDEEDFFKVPELDTNFEKEDQSIFKSDLFETSKSSKPDESLLFDGAPVLSPLSSRRAEELTKKLATDKSLVGEKAKPKTASIFDDNDDDLNGDDNDEQDNLFKSRKPLGGGFAARSEEKVRKSLFDEDSDGDEDELFGGRSVAVAPRTAPVGKLKEESQGGGKGKEEKGKGKEISSFVDPLGLIPKD